VTIVYGHYYGRGYIRVKWSVRDELHTIKPTVRLKDPERAAEINLCNGLNGPWGWFFYFIINRGNAVTRQRGKEE
jgi:hypothetical protein